VIPFEFRHDLWHQKTRIMGLSCSVVCVILRIAVLIQYLSVSDTQTHKHTDRHTTTANTALSIASRGKSMYSAYVFLLYQSSHGMAVKYLVFCVQLAKQLGKFLPR